MKRISVITIIFLLVFTCFSYAQDCGNCPVKSKCKKAKLKDQVVCVDKDAKIYHKLDCETLQKELPKMKLTKAKKNNYKACSSCFPPKKSKIKKNTSEKK